MADHQLPAIRRGRLETLTIYEVSEAELETIERGTPESVFLNFAIFLLSVAISFSVTLATVTIASDRTFQVFVIVTLVCYLGGLILLAIWGRSYRSIRRTTQTIRERLLAEGEQIPAEPGDDG